MSNVEGSTELVNDEGVVWSNIIGLMLSLVVWVPFTSATQIYWQVFLYAIGATPFAISLIYVAATASFSISRIYGGYLSDKFGRKILIVFLTYLAAATYLMMYFAEDWIQILVAEVIMSFALLYNPALTSIIVESAPPEKRGKTLTAVSLVAQIAAIISPYIALILVTKHGLVQGVRITFMLAFITGIIAATVRLLTLKETLKLEKRDMGKSLISSYKDAANFIRRRMLVPLSFRCSVALIYSIIYLQQLYALQYLEISYEEWALINMAITITAIILMLPAGAIADKFGRKRPTITASIIWLVGIACIAIAPKGRAFTYVLGGLITLTIASVVRMSAYVALEADLLPDEIRGKGYALLGTIESAISIIGLIAGGILYTQHPRTPFIIATFLTVITITLSFFLPETLRTKTTQQIYNKNLGE